MDEQETADADWGRWSPAPVGVPATAPVALGEPFPEHRGRGLGVWLVEFLAPLHRNKTASI
jgi:hypothetical protein